MTQSRHTALNKQQPFPNGREVGSGIPTTPRVAIFSEEALFPSVPWFHFRRPCSPRYWMDVADIDTWSAAVVIQRHGVVQQLATLWRSLNPAAVAALGLASPAAAPPSSGLAAGIAPVDLTFERRMTLAIAGAMDTVALTSAARSLTYQEVTRRAAILMEEQSASRLVASSSPLRSLTTRVSLLDQREAACRIAILDLMRAETHALWEREVPMRRCAQAAVPRRRLWDEAVQCLKREFEEEYQGWLAGMQLMEQDDREAVVSRSMARGKGRPTAPTVVATPAATAARSGETTVRGAAPPVLAQPAATGTEAALISKHAGLFRVPAIMPFVVTVDLSGNHISSISDGTFPYLGQLRQLLLYDNRLEDSVSLTRTVATNCPRITDLGLLGNPCAMRSMTEDVKSRYRSFVATVVSVLTSLDGVPITSAEREMGRRMFSQFAVSPGLPPPPSNPQYGGSYTAAYPAPPASGYGGAPPPATSYGYNNTPRGPSQDGSSMAGLYSNTGGGPGSNGRRW